MVIPVSFMSRDLEMCPGIEETTLGLANVDLATLLVEKYGEKIRVRSRTCSRWVFFSLAETSSFGAVQSIYRGRVEIGEVYLPSQLKRTYTTTLLVMVDRIEGGGRASPTSHQVGLIFPS
jgi:hypothetical protein